MTHELMQKYSVLVLQNNILTKIHHIHHETTAIKIAPQLRSESGV
jgi:hypothetical protein